MQYSGKKAKTYMLLLVVSCGLPIACAKPTCSVCMSYLNSANEIGFIRETNNCLQGFILWSSTVRFITEGQIFWPECLKLMPYSMFIHSTFPICLMHSLTWFSCRYAHFEVEILKQTIPNRILGYFYLSLLLHKFSLMKVHIGPAFNRLIFLLSTNRFLNCMIH